VKKLGSESEFGTLVDSWHKRLRISQTTWPSRENLIYPLEVKCGGQRPLLVEEALNWLHQVQTYAHRGVSRSQPVVLRLPRLITWKHYGQLKACLHACFIPILPYDSYTDLKSSRVI